MSPLAALVEHALAPGVVAFTLAVEWMAVWFVCWRHVRATTGHVLAANLVVLGGPGLLLAAGSLGTPATLDTAGVLAWIGAGLALLLVSVTAEALVLTALMRRRRPGWGPSPYDLGLLAGSRALALAAACLHLWLVGAS